MINLTKKTNTPVTVNVLFEALQLRGHCSKRAGYSKIEKKVKHNSNILVPVVSKRAGYENKYNNQI